MPPICENIQLENGYVWSRKIGVIHASSLSQLQRFWLVEAWPLTRHHAFCRFGMYVLLFDQVTGIGSEMWV